MLNKFLRHFFILVLAIAGLIYLGVRNYDYLYSDEDLLSMATCLKYAEDDVLGNKLYSETCPRSSYSAQVEILSSANGETNKSGGFAFKFHPIPENEKTCPAVTIVVSRHTGEAWITNVASGKETADPTVKDKRPTPAGQYFIDPNKAQNMSLVDRTLGLNQGSNEPSLHNFLFRIYPLDCNRQRGHGVRSCKITCPIKCDIARPDPASVCGQCAEQSCADLRREGGQGGV